MLKWFRAIGALIVAVALAGGAHAQFKPDPVGPAPAGKVGGAAGGPGGLPGIHYAEGAAWAAAIVGDTLVVTNMYGDSVRDIVVAFGPDGDIRVHEFEDPTGGARIAGGSVARFTGDGAPPFPLPGGGLVGMSTSVGPWSATSDDNDLFVYGPNGETIRFWLSSNGWFELDLGRGPITVFNHDIYGQLASALP